MENDWWIELENTYRMRIAQRKELYATHGKRVLDYLPGSELACKEVMEIVLQYVCARYPQYFSLVDKRIFQNRILDTKQDVRSKHPLEFLMDNIPEDFGIMLRDDETGSYILRAGVICSSIDWSLDEKIGLPLGLVHEPVAEYKEKMETSMDRYVPLYTGNSITAAKPDTIKVSSLNSQPINQSNEAPGASRSASHYGSPRAMATESMKQNKTQTFYWKVATSAWTGRRCVDYLSPRPLYSILKQFSRL